MNVSLIWGVLQGVSGMTTQPLLSFVPTLISSLTKESMRSFVVTHECFRSLTNRSMQ